MPKLSVVLATYNEEENLSDCLSSVKDIASEIIIVDGSSTDSTVAIAEKFGAQVVVTENQKIFHINKQKALDLAKHEWILQLDADERVSEKLAKEIQHVVTLSKEALDIYEEKIKNKKLFDRHTKLLEVRDGSIGTKSGDYAAFFIPRMNFFLGRFLTYGGVYPDGVIRLVRKNTAHFPCVSVHEQIVVDGKVGWLENDLLHMADPTFSRYLLRWGRYTSLIADEIRNNNERGLNTALKYLFVSPLSWFLMTFFRHKGIFDLWPGFVFSLFSSLRFPVGYIKYLQNT